MLPEGTAISPPSTLPAEKARDFLRITSSSLNAVHFTIRMAPTKSMRVVGSGVRGRSL
jgi:hypothetical protein